jgi:hypothetical protein
MERTQHKQDKYDRSIDDRINELISHYPEDKRISFTTCITRGSRCMTIG